MHRKPSDLIIKIRNIAEHLTGFSFFITAIFMLGTVFFSEKEYPLEYIPMTFAFLSAAIYFKINANIKIATEIAVRKLEKKQGTLDMCKSDTLFDDINADLKQELTNLIINQKKDEAIKRYREETGRGQKKAKAVIEYLADTD